LNPDLRYAKRKLAYTLKQAGIPYLAARYANQFSAEFGDQELYPFAHDHAAQTIGFGQAQLEFDNRPSRFNSIDVALTENDGLTARFGAADPTGFDRIVALKDRLAMQEAVALYRLLADAGIDTPAYVKFAAADAFLSLREPEMARDLYLRGLAQLGSSDTDLLGVQISLIYAYNEAGQYSQAEALSDKLLAHQRRYLGEVANEGAPDFMQVNPDFLRAAEVSAMLKISNNRLAAAQADLTALRTDLPLNNDLRSVWIALQRAREHPRLSLDEYSMMHIDNPGLVDVALGRCAVLLSLNELASAQQCYADIVSDDAATAAVQNFADSLRQYRLPWYRIESRIGRGAVRSGADSLSDALIYSAPLAGLLNDRVRLFSHLILAEGETDSGAKPARNRLGMGLEYRSQDLEAQAELNRTLDSPNNDGLALTLTRHISDSWKWQALLDTNVVDLPAAALADGIRARELNLSVTWSQNEARSAGAEITQMRFSDGNTRVAPEVWWLERWVSNPVLKLDTVLALASSANSALNRPYFNPVRDEDLNLAFKAEWLNWQRYARSFKQTFELGIGRYWQRDFGGGPTAAAQYGHLWALDNDLAVSYGVGASFQPYDGKREYQRYVFLNLSGRIK
jgi:poly-beta-1,6 N-acetyl-D-glucosamine export porin PgaA